MPRKRKSWKMLRRLRKLRKRQEDFARGIGVCRFNMHTVKSITTFKSLCNKIVVKLDMKPMKIQK